MGDKATLLHICIGLCYKALVSGEYLFDYVIKGAIIVFSQFSRFVV